MIHKVAVITGGTGAVGSAAVDAFLEQGATVAAVARETSRMKRNASDRFYAFSADVTNKDEVKILFDEIDKKCGGADFLIHTVGGFWGGVDIRHTELQDWDRMMSINLRSAFLCCRAALPYMAEKGGGKIITISALAGLEPKPNRAAYLTAKAALIAFTRAIAEEGRNINVQANTLAPNIILTESNKRDMPDMDHSSWVKPEDMAATMVHLCSEQSSTFTGNVIKML